MPRAARMEPRSHTSSSPERYPAIGWLQLLNTLSGWLLMAGAVVSALVLQISFAVGCLVGAIACFATNALLQIAVDCEGHLRDISTVHLLQKQQKTPPRGFEPRSQD